MDANEVISRLRSDLSARLARGETAIPLSSLAHALAELGVAITVQGDPAQSQRALEMLKLQEPLVHQSRLAMFTSVLEAGQTTLKTLLTINGGAAVALLAFIGNLLTKPTPPGIITIDGLKLTMLVFLGGVATAAIATGARYVSQNLYRRDRHAGGDAWAWISFGAGTLSLLSFIAGGILAYLAF